MTATDLDALRDLIRPLAAVARHHALAIDADPSVLPRLVKSGVLPYRQIAGFPPEYLDEPLRIQGVPVYVRSCVERVVVAETLAWGDASIGAGVPGPSMAGLVVDDLADEAQRERFYRQVSNPHTWTYFGLTEPARGSDAASLDAAVGSAGATQNQLTLNGAKKYVGNIARADIGVVFARHGRGPLGVGVYLLETNRSGFDARPLTSTGMRAIELGEAHFGDVPISAEDQLGRHLSPSRRGLVGAIRTFNRLRPLVAALALGVTKAALDYVRTERSALKIEEQWRLEVFEDRLHAARAIMLAAARAADEDPADGTLASIAKATAMGLAEDVLRVAPAMLGPGSRWEHPYLDKLVRDLPGLEMMEGTRTVQRLTIAQGVLRGHALI